MKNNKWLWLGIGLIVFSLFYSGKISLPILPSADIKQTISFKEPNQELKTLCLPIIEALQNGSNDRAKDGHRLAQLYMDMSTLIMADENILKTTDAIREANVLSAKMLNINLKGKYDGLAESADKLFKEYVSENSVSLDKELRKKSSEAFQALAWAFYKGSK